MRRTLDPDERLPVVTLKSLGLHPLIYRKRIARVDRGVGVGDLVEVRNDDSLRAGFGIYNPKSELALRVLSRGDELPTSAWWKGRLEEAVRLRREVLRLDEASDAYRVVHDLRVLTLAERKQRLREVLNAGGSDVLQYSDHIDSDGDAFLRES